MYHDHKSLEGLSPERAGMLHVAVHAHRMRDMGLKSQSQVDDVMRHIIARGLDTMPAGEYEHLVKSGLLDRLRAAAGGGDDEHPADAARRQHGETVSTLVHLVGCHVGAGHCSPEHALEQIKPYFGDLPEADAREILNEMMSRIHSRRPLHDGASDAEQRREVSTYVKAKYGSASDEEPASPDEAVDSYVKQKYGKRRR